MRQQLTPSLSLRVATVFGFAVLLNYPWELAQMPLFAMHESHGNVLWRCFIASLGDGVLVLLIFAAGWVIWRRQDWFERSGAAAWALMLTVGLIIAIAVEWNGLAMGRWNYAESMPRVPALNVGITPIAQMLVLPPIIFSLAARCLHRTKTPRS